VELVLLVAVVVQVRLVATGMVSARLVMVVQV
jgi:hypothetical protein